MWFNQYPYINVNDLNLDYILRTLKQLRYDLENFVNINTIKYANPIQWNITTQYEANTVVVDGNDGTAYLSVKPVPSGVAITNTDYWTPVFTLNLLSANQNITLRNDGSNVTATFTSDVGDWIIWNNILYRVSRPIAINESYVVGYNLTRYSVELFIRNYVNELQNMIGDLDDLTTTNKDDIVSAINEINTLITNAISTIEGEIDLFKYYVTPEEYGAVGDGVTDDTQAFEDAIRSGLPVKCMMGKTYKVGVLDLHDLERIFLDGNHAKIVGAQFHVNVNIGSNSWIQAYAWASYINNVYFISNGNETALHLGCSLRMKNCIFDDYFTAIDFTNNYIDETKVEDTSFRNYNRGDNNTPRITHPGLGDLLYIKGCHHTGNVNYIAKYIYSGSYVNSGVMIENISCGIYLGANSCVDIISCKFPVSGVARIDFDGYNSQISCHNCHFAGVGRFNNKVKYYDCTFVENAWIGGVNGLNIADFKKQCTHCIVGVHKNPASAGMEAWVNSDDCSIDHFDYYITTGDIFIPNSIYAIDSDGVPGVPQTGSYTYYVVPSMYPNAHVRNASNVFNYNLQTSATAGQTIYFRTAREILTSYRHVYRVNPDSSVNHAVLPPARFYDNFSGTIVDNGTCNGFAWESLGAIPTIAASSVSMTNGIVSANDPNLPTGALYIDNTNIKQK